MVKDVFLELLNGLLLLVVVRIQIGLLCRVDLLQRDRIRCYSSFRTDYLEHRLERQGLICRHAKDISSNNLH